MTIPSECGICDEPAEYGRIVHDQGVPLHHDCAQARMRHNAELLAVRLTTPRKLTLGQAYVEIIRQS